MLPFHRSRPAGRCRNVAEMRGPSTGLIVLSLAFAVASAPATAVAQSVEEQARRSFEQGLAAEQTGRSVEACESFRKSLGLVREIGPLLKVKDCDVRERKLVSARAALEELIKRWPGQDADLEQLKAELQVVIQRTPRLTVTSAPSAPAGIRVRLDGRSIALPQTELPVDPGDHEILVELPQRPIEGLTITIQESERKSISVPAPPAWNGEPKPVGPRPPPAQDDGLSGLAIGGIVAGSVGVLGFVGAAITGALVLGKQSEFEDCQAGTPNGCDPVALKDEGDTLLVANGVLFGVGILGVGLGATLLIVDAVSTPSPAAKVELGLGPASAMLRVRF